MIISDHAIEILRPPHEVFAYLMDISNYKLWQSGLVEVKASKGLQVGSEIVFTSIGIGQTFKLRAVVTENDLATSFRVLSRQGPVSFDSQYVLETNGSHTILSVINRVDTGSIFKITENVLQSVSDAKYQADLKTLKALLEAS